ncbi:MULTISPECIES: hypothetical protein [unclassified Enterococcus]|uniref:hypothetical protein n=1 Tax=unclassified Enterococcus TaxID=2608891 RepID=UPI001553B1BC|nr:MULTISPECIES: hypothetical protein [unclassified Enterococcus]MBS7576952.1 hypothetical protein [Enterococcus sp. MMGLQ5-2]MBS7584359.1 hypothetical protein [Enterococcus sp. MMGLQ5-1]NPD12214.1 hypothetical protein [Enterococcus sp. MMGLQ5-1]NPD36786.1 hypothetical protein [Enterococcus sp. MMGLQ5-2]
MQQVFEVEELTEGDLVSVYSYETNCGINEGSFVGLVIESAKYGLCILPSNISEFAIEREAIGGSIFLPIKWLIDDVDVRICKLAHFE